MDLHSSVAVVTGSASGIGRATAIALAREGADLVLADVNGPGVDAVATEIAALGRKTMAIEVDVTGREAVLDLVDRAIAWQGRCDLFMSNVGVGCRGAPHEFTADQWEYLIAVNLWSAIWPLQKLIPHMLERGRGHLVFVSSGAGFEGTAESAPYNVAKFGVVGLSEAVARYLKDTGVTVSLVVPGAVATDGWKTTVYAGEDPAPDEIDRRRLAQRDHSSSWPSPDAMAEVILRGVREDRYCILQPNPFEPDWYQALLTRKARDPDGFVLGVDRDT